MQKYIRHDKLDIYNTYMNCVTSGNIYLNMDKYHAIRYRIRTTE